MRGARGLIPCVACAVSLFSRVRVRVVLCPLLPLVLVLLVGVVVQRSSAMCVRPVP